MENPHVSQSCGNDYGGALVLFVLDHVNGGRSLRGEEVRPSMVLERSLLTAGCVLDIEGTSCGTVCRSTSAASCSSSASHLCRSTNTITVGHISEEAFLARSALRFGCPWLHHELVIGQSILQDHTLL